MGEERNVHRDLEAQKKRKDERMVDPEKNENAFEEQALDNKGRDWTKRKTFLPEGEV